MVKTPFQRKVRQKREVSALSSPQDAKSPAQEAALTPKREQLKLAKRAIVVRAAPQESVLEPAAGHTAYHCKTEGADHEKRRPSTSNRRRQARKQAKRLAEEAAGGSKLKRDSPAKQQHLAADTQATYAEDDRVKAAVPNLPLQMPPQQPATHSDTHSQHADRTKRKRCLGQMSNHNSRGLAQQRKMQIVGQQEGDSGKKQRTATEKKKEKSSGTAERSPIQAPREVAASVALPVSGSASNPNWAALKAIIGAGQQKDVRHKGSLPADITKEARRPRPLGPHAAPTRVLAVDCEMVGVGPDGARSSLARVCIVNDEGNVLMDKLVRQKERVTDFRTKYSGIRPADLHESKAVPLEEVQEEAAKLMKDRVLVGHAIQNDLKALLLSHPRKAIRDTARYPPLMRATAPGRKPRPRALRHLAFEILGLGIQGGEHSPVEDARAALYLYQRHAKEWEHSIRTGGMKKLQPTLQGKGQPLGKSLAELAAKDIMVDL